MINASLKDGNIKVEMEGTPIDLLSEAQCMYIEIVEDLIRKSPDMELTRKLIKQSTLKIFQKHI